MLIIDYQSSKEFSGQFKSEDLEKIQVPAGAAPGE